jgi:hypothetical protein
MKKFLCTFYLPALMEADFWETIPAHRAYINEQMKEDVIVTYSVNMQRSKGWVVISANSEKKAEVCINGFPIRRFIDFEIEELFIFDTMIGAPKLVLN